MPNFTRMLSSKFYCKNFKIWNIQIQGLYKDFQGLLKDPMNRDYYTKKAKMKS